MTPAEASIHLALSNAGDIHDAIENNLFQAKQELIQKADHILLFASKEKKWKTLQEAGETLGYTFPEDNNIPVLEWKTDTMEDNFHSFHQQRSQCLQKLNAVSSFNGIIEVQKALLSNYMKWLDYWQKTPLIFEMEDVKLSSSLDPMLLLQWILSLKTQAIQHATEIQLTLVPKDIMHELTRLKLLYERMK